MDLENRNELPNSLEEHWMPFTSNHDFKDNPRLMVKAEGVYYTDHHGNQLIDASSGLFCSPAGHGRKEIRDAVYKQLEQLDYVQPFQQGYNGSFELARKIAKHTPEDLNKIFFTMCGSSAVDTAIKTAIAYFKAKGEGHRHHIVGRERGYHGVNIAGITVGGMVASWWQPLASAIVNGLAFSTILTLLLTPAMLLIPDIISKRLGFRVADHQFEDEAS